MRENDVTLGFPKTSYCTRFRFEQHKHGEKHSFIATGPFITERLLMGRKDSNQTKQTNKHCYDIQKSLRIVEEEKNGTAVRCKR